MTNVEPVWRAPQEVTEEFISEISKPKVTDFLIQVRTDELENPKAIKAVLDILPRKVHQKEIKYEGGTYQNLMSQTIAPRANWTDIKIGLGELGLLDRVIAICAGDHGWDDYHILHHPKIKA